MIPPSDQFRDQVDRLFWEYVEKMDDGSMTCAFCGHLFAQHTSISRIKLHLSGVVGRDVKICGQVPQDVQDAARAAIDGPPEKNLKTVAGSSNGVMAQQGDALLESENNDVENMVRVRTEAVEEEENNSGRLEQPVAGASSSGGLVDNRMCHAPGRSVEDSIDNGTGGVAQPGAEASSSGGLRHNPSETRGAPLLTGSTRLVGQAFEENKNVIWSYRLHRWNYDVTDHLYSALLQAGIHTFRDDKKLPRGEEISPQLLRAIEGSRISVVVFSRNYASSRWCLDELVKIMECRQKTPHVVIPVFYHTDPSDVRKQTGSYAKAFDEHEEHFKGEMEKVNRWREALTQAANLSGRVLDNETKGYEAKFIKNVVKDVACKLGNKTLPVAKHLSAGQSSGGLVGNTNEIKGDALPTRKLVGQAFEDNKKFIWSLLMGDEVSSIGIYGMAGVGKTTLVTHLYNQLLERPEIHVYWITASQDTSIYKLQTSLARRIQLDLSNEDDEQHRAVALKKELMKKQHKWVLILDDLWNFFDLQKLGIPDQAEGCKLILTTRSEKICQQMKTQHTITVRPILEEEAWILFIERLGRDIELSPEVKQIAVDVVRECAGLPLEIITMAGSMRGVNDPHEWRNTLKKLKESNFRDMEDEVFRLLRFSYDRLDDVALQQCLLYCVLFPEGHEIEREELIFYLIDGGIIENMWSREAAFQKGHAMLDRLENAGLLERIDGGRAVKMHDLVRDVAIRICKENPSVMEQRRKGIEMAGSNIDPFWNHVELTNDDSILKCKFCGNTFAKGTSLSRIKWHLSGERGHGVTICGQVPKQVQEATFLSMHGGNSCSPEELPHDTFQTIPITEPVVQVLGQSNVELDNFSVGAERTQVEEEEEEDMLNNSGRVAQPGAGASSSGGLRHNPNETRGAPCSTKLGGRAFEENKNVILSWLKDDKVSIIGIYGMAGAGKTTLLKHICNERSPDICYPVYLVTLSPDLSIHKLQNKIAESIQLSFSIEEEELGLRAEKLSQKPLKKQRCWKEEKLGRRAKELSQELMKKQRWILILDNLCNSFKLDEVGIPVPFKGCKLIMTTRSEAVCRQMNSENNVRVNPLSTEESWTLWYLQGGFLCCQGQGRKRIEMARLKSGWTMLLTNLILEIASAGFDQLGYALVGMVLAFVALLLAAADLIHMPRKERTSLLPSFHRQSASTFAPWNPVGTIVEYFGLVGGVWQCFYSTVEYAYAHQKRDNIIKMCLLPFLFLSCVVISILIKKSYIDKRA